MKILYISQYFPPEMGAPSGRVFELSKRWVENGANVTVITGFPHHPTGIIPEKYQKLKFLRENISGISVLRTYVFATPNRGFVKRVLSYMSFMFSSIISRNFSPDLNVLSNIAPERMFFILVLMMAPPLPGL